MSSHYGEFKKELSESISRCHCHCSQCCQCDRPNHDIKIDQKLIDDPRFTHEELMKLVQMMRIPGTSGTISYYNQDYKVQGNHFGKE